MAIASEGDGAVAPRVQLLDGLRGVAVLMVLGYHAGFEVTYGLTLETGVDLFFVLSGFLITGILLRTRQRSDYFRLFYARRSLRIFPLYYAFLALAILLAFVVVQLDLTGWIRSTFAENILQNQIWGWVYQVNNLLAFQGEGAFGGLEHLWSLAIEEQFYLLWPLVVRFVPTNRLLRVSLAIVVGSAAFRAVGYAVGGRDFAYFFTLCRLDGLALGAVGAILMLDPRLRERARPAVQWVGRFWWVVPLLLLVPRGLSLYVGTLLLIVGYLGLVLAADMGTLAARPSRWLDSAFLRRIGGYGYAIYLFSLPIAQVTRKIQPTGAVLIDGLFSMAATLAVSYVLAWISWNVLESRFLRLKSRFAYVPEAPAAR